VLIRVDIFAYVASESFLVIGGETDIFIQIKVYLSICVFL
jgi:hypothetical protein